MLHDEKKQMDVGCSDSGNNRVTLFKKYLIAGKPRFRFFRFLGDEEGSLSEEYL